MPKKSRREKMLADIRRRARRIHVEPATPVESPVEKSTATFQFSSVTTAPEPVKESVSSSGELIAIKKDLVKTMVLAAIAVSFELILFWLERR